MRIPTWPDIQMMMTSTSLSLVAVLVAVLVAGAVARSDLPNHTELVVAVAADPGWVRGRGLLLDTVRDLVKRSVASAASARVSMDLVFHTLNDDTLADIVAG